MKRVIVTALFFLATVTFTTSNCFAQSPSRDDLLKELKAKRAELQLLEKQFLAPAAEDHTAYAEFLSQPDTGLIRLLPREAFDSDVYKKIKGSLAIRGGGAYYSFTRLTHEYGSGSDLELGSDHFSVGFAGADYGMLVNLGDVALDEITLEHPRVRYLAAYAPPSQEPSARLAARQFGQGVTVDGVLYKNRLPAEVSSTYLLRSIGYSHSDVLVAFKVVRKDSDGSFILAWKLLGKYPVPDVNRKDVLELAR
jgi:hypothetical protein